jgi:hypothetical protein
MNIETIEKKLNKIKSVLDVFKEDGKLSKIEKDLLLGYIRDLYEEISNNDSNVVQKINQEQPVVVEKKVVEKEAEKAKAAELPLTTDNEKLELTATTPKFDEAEVKIIEENIFKTDTQIESQINEVKTNKATIAIPDENMQHPSNGVNLENKPSEISIEKVNPTSKLLPHAIPDELIELFADDEYTDLSDKISMFKIDQISNSIGINERFYMIKELFNGDGNLFFNILDKLDNAGNLDYAKQIALEEVAIPMKWVENGKLTIADEFIKLIKRKYK